MICPTKYSHGFVVLCLAVVIPLIIDRFMWLTCTYHSGLLHWHWGNLRTASIPVKWSWEIWLISQYVLIKTQWCLLHNSWDALYGYFQNDIQRIWMKTTDSKVHVAHMGPTWVLSALGGPHVGPTNLAIWVYSVLLLFCCNVPPEHSQQIPQSFPVKDGFGRIKV